MEQLRDMPAEDQQQVPALLNGLGKLQVGAGDFGGARQTFAAVARAAADAPGKAEASYN